ncbi:MAG: NnrU family protein [Burkholderiales bacterium]
MIVLIIGLIVLLGTHSIRIVADDWRTRQVARLGLRTYKNIYSVVAVVGFVLIVWGYGLARLDPVVLWTPPVWTRHVAALLTFPAFILLAAASPKGNFLKAAVGHPMVLGVKVWAFAHLLANGMLADVVLFGAFLVWSIADFAAARRRDRREGTVHPRGTSARNLGTLIAGTAVWVVFAFWLHAWLIGVAPFG